MPSAMSRPMKESHARQLKRDAEINLEADLKESKRFNHWVIVCHEEGTQYVLRNAFFECDPADGNYVWVFTEHQGNFIFDDDELTTCVELQEVQT